MDAIEALKTRKSVRKFIDKDVPNDIITDILDCARLAPSAHNLQPWRFVVIKNKETLKKIESLCDYGKFISTAPVVIAVFCEDVRRKVEDGCAATQNILLSATAHGLGACWVAGHNKDYAEEVAKMLGAPEGLSLISMIPIGYFENKFGRVAKKQLSEVVFYEKF